MALLETAILSIGSGIAKGVLRYWLGSESSPIQEYVWDNLIDVLKDKTSDVLAQRSADRQFQVIAEESAKNVIATINFENGKLSEERVEYLIRIAGDAVNKAVASPALIVENNLEPTKLSDCLGLYVDYQEQGGELSNEEKSILERMLYEASQHIIDISSELPGFTEKTFSEILKREDSLLAQASRILDEIRRLRESTRNIAVESAVFENDFRRDVARRLDELQLFGVDVSNTSKRYKLSVAYVSLMVEEVEDGLNIDKKDKENTKKTENISESMKVDVALLKGKRLLVRGAAGSGKTTLLQWVAVTSSSRAHEGELDILNECIPFFIRLRAVGEVLPAPEDMVKLASPQLVGKMPYGWAHEKLDTGKALILVDGLDEIEEKRRSEVKDWLKSLTETFPKVRYIVSTRPHAAKEGWLDAQDFVEVEMQDMSSTDIQSFIGHWHASVKEVEMSEDKKRELDGLGAKLVKTLQNNSSLRRLATSPLLCALICALHRDRIENLPTRRVELYRACVDMFLRRDVERKIVSGNYPNLDETQKRTILQELALWMMRGKQSQVSKVEADQRIDLTLKSLQSLPDGVTASKIRKLFVERSGILREPTVDKIDFPHRTFQEYLAAQAALDDISIKELISNAHDDQWQETIILAAGLARPHEAEELIKGLINRGDKERKYQHAIYLLAVAAQQGIVKLSPNSQIKREVSKRLSKVVPPRTITEAKSLSAAGDLVVPYLKYRKQVLKIAIPNIRCLTLIGTDASFRELMAYSDDKRRGIIEEFEKSQKYVDDSADFAERYLYKHWFGFIDDDRNCNVDSVSFTGKPVKDISLLRTCDGLEEIGLRGTLVEDITPLQFCHNLESLDLNDSRVTDVSPLSSCEKLKYLDIGNTKVDISTLGGLSMLEEIVLGGRPGIEIQSLTNCPKLKIINVRNVYKLDLKKIGNLSELECLNIFNVHEVDFTPLSECRNLKKLAIFSSPLHDLSPILKLRELETLSLHRVDTKRLPDLSRIRKLKRLSLAMASGIDVSFLRNCTQLESLKLLDIYNTDISAIASLKNLKELFLDGALIENISVLNLSDKITLLDLANTNVKDLNPLASCPNLENLYLEKTKVSDISVLAKLPKLKNVVLWNTLVKDLSPLANCEELIYLDLDSTPVQDISPLSSCKKLERLDIRYTSIQDISPLRDLVKSGLKVYL